MLLLTTSEDTSREPYRQLEPKHQLHCRSCIAATSWRTLPSVFHQRESRKETAPQTCSKPHQVFLLVLYKGMTCCWTTKFSKYKCRTSQFKNCPFLHALDTKIFHTLLSPRSWKQNLPVTQQTNIELHWFYHVFLWTAVYLKPSHAFSGTAAFRSDWIHETWSSASMFWYLLHHVPQFLVLKPISFHKLFCIEAFHVNISEAAVFCSSFKLFFWLSRSCGSRNGSLARMISLGFGLFLILTCAQ